MVYDIYEGLQFSLQMAELQDQKLIYQVCQGRGVTRMAFKYKNSKGKDYYLHAKVRKTSTGKEQRLYFFAQTVKDGSLDAVPAGYMVTESPNGLPLLKKK
jgi:hypothetical protein